MDLSERVQPYQRYITVSAPRLLSNGFAALLAAANGAPPGTVEAAEGANSLGSAGGTAARIRMGS